MLGHKMFYIHCAMPTVAFCGVSENNNCTICFKESEIIEH